MNGPREIGEVMQRLDELVSAELLLQTHPDDYGPSPDEYKDYFVDKQIPELLPAFESMIQHRTPKRGLETSERKRFEAAALNAAIILQRCDELT